ncbi:Non-canonical non-ribosomal peptide synthetase FUB8 [Paramyrothecium foliicola]|nr:Non-canonical non-ribosomal peptide synthetase FUB8 [Paramyrothecium foliicola]
MQFSNVLIAILTIGITQAIPYERRQDDSGSASAQVAGGNTGAPSKQPSGGNSGGYPGGYSGDYSVGYSGGQYSGDYSGQYSGGGSRGGSNGGSGEEDGPVGSLLGGVGKSVGGIADGVVDGVLNGVGEGLVGLSGEDHNILIPHAIDKIASETPDRVYGLWPVHPFSYEAGFRTITFGDLANAVNGLSQWLETQLGRSSNHETVAYIGPNDVRFIALMVAAIKTGFVLFTPSPRNSSEAHKALFESVHCRTLLTTDPAPPPAAIAVEAVKPRTFAIPSLEMLLDQVHPEHEYSSTFEEVRNKPLLILHTSGSTGLPKPLVWTHEAGFRHQNLSTREVPNGVPSIENYCRGKSVMVTLPPFHGAGMTQYLLHSIALDLVPVAPAAKGIVTAQGLLEALQHTPTEIALLVPSVVTELAQDIPTLEACAKYLKLILYIGGDLPQSIGDKVASKIPLRCQWGASEVGIPQQLMPHDLDQSDWRYVCFHPSLGAKFEAVADDLYELVIPRHDGLADTQTPFCIHGHGQSEKEYRTRDLFTKHPSVSDTWSWKARSDDIIVFLNGEKTNPISMEQHILASNPELTGALVIGSQKLQAGLIVEPAESGSFETTAQQAALIERIWASVDEANHRAPAHARVQKSFVLITRRDRPMVRAGKGTIQRLATTTEYATEIEKLYTDADAEDIDDESGDGFTYPQRFAVTSFVSDIVQSVTQWPTLQNCDNFFDQGLDSLQALQITRAIRRKLQQPTFALSTVYKHPTIKLLTNAIFDQSARENGTELIESLFATYEGLLKRIPVPANLKPGLDKPMDILLTGSTGHVFCLNRGQDGGRSAQFERLTAALIPVDDVEKRVSFLNADLTHPHLGVDNSTYEMLKARVHVIIHNAWPVNFNLQLLAFRPQLASIINLYALAAAAAPRTVKFTFVSTIAAMGSLADHRPAPETIQDLTATPHPQGYAQSKFNAELLCKAAADHLKIPITVLRVGQVAGPIRRQGLWNPNEWLPSLVRSSVYLRCLPNNLGNQFSEVDWIPSDVLADVVVDIVGDNTLRTDSGVQVFNLRNPLITTWISPADWLDRLQESIVAIAAEPGSQTLAIGVAQNPAIRLFEFYRDGLWADVAYIPPMGVERAVKASHSLRSLPAMDPDWMHKWVLEWMEHDK